MIRGIESVVGLLGLERAQSGRRDSRWPDKAGLRAFGGMQRRFGKGWFQERLAQGGEIVELRLAERVDKNGRVVIGPEPSMVAIVEDIARQRRLWNSKIAGKMPDGFRNAAGVHDMQIPIERRPGVEPIDETVIAIRGEGATDSDSEIRAGRTRADPCGVALSPTLSR